MKEQAIDQPEEMSVLEFQKESFKYQLDCLKLEIDLV